MQSVAFTFAWTKAVVEARGWRYEVSTEPPPIELDNVRFLAGYRRAELIDRKLLNELGLGDLNGLTLGEAVRAHGRHPDPIVRSAVLHLLW